MEPVNPFRCYDRRTITEALLVALVLMGLALFGKRFALGTAPRIAIGVAEAALFGFLIVRMLIQVRKLDELGQRIHLVAIAIAFGLTGLVLSLGQFLALAGVNVGQLGVWVLTFMLFAWGIGVIVIAGRYR